MSAGTLGMHTVAGVTFKSSARTAAHLRDTIAALKRSHPEARLRIIQPCFTDPQKYPLSAGTHSLDAVFDVEIVGMNTGSDQWYAAQRFLRANGWAAWFRHTGSWASPNAWHIHMISLGYPGKVAKYIDGGVSLYGRKVASSQVDDYYAHAYGLANQHRPGSDTSWFPPDIKATIFDYNAYTARVAAAQPTYYDIRVALGRLEVASKNEKAKPIYRRAASIVGKLVPDARRVRVPETTNQVIAALAYKREHSRNYWTKYRLSVCIRILRPLA